MNWDMVWFILLGVVAIAALIWEIWFINELVWAFRCAFGI